MCHAARQWEVILDINGEEGLEVFQMKMTGMIFHMQWSCMCESEDVNGAVGIF